MRRRHFLHLAAVGAMMLLVAMPASAHVSEWCKPAWTRLAEDYKRLERAKDAKNRVLRRIVDEDNYRRREQMALDLLANEDRLLSIADVEFHRQFRVVLACTDGKQ